MAPIYSVADARRRARRALPRILYDFIEGGAGEESTLADNRAAFNRLRLRPLAAVDVGEPELAVTLLGQPVQLPVLLAPCGGVSMVHPDGQVGVARAAASRGTLAAVSTLCGSDLDEVARAGGVAHWFQLYKLGGRAGAEILVERAAQAGYAVLMLAVDTPVVSRKERDLRNGGVRPGGLSLDRIDLPTLAHFAPKVIGRPRWVYRFVRAGFPIGHPSLRHLAGADGNPLAIEEAMGRWKAEPATWADLEWIRKRWPGPLVVKGVLTGDDAARAVDLGADGVVVSNHGGRQLDGCPATIDSLPEVVDALPAQVDVFLDGGVRRGVDVVRALALGAKAVFVGRPYLHGLAVAGADGVMAVLDVLRDELVEAMRLLGCASVDGLEPGYLW